MPTTETPTERRLRDIVRTINGEPLADEKAIDKGRQAIELMRALPEACTNVKSWNTWRGKVNVLLAACQED